MKKLNFDGLGLEAIGFQRDKQLHKELTSLFERMRGAVDDKAREIILAEMANSIFISTGIANHLHVTEGWNGPAIAVRPITRTHPFIYKTMQKALAANDNEHFKAVVLDKIVDGKVDLKNSTVSGDFSKIFNEIFIPDNFWRSDLLTPAECSATLLHEIGHAFGYFELLGHTCVTNLVMNEVTKAWVGNYPVEKRVLVLTGVENQYGTKIEDKDAVAANSTAEVALAVVANLAVNEVRSELKTPHYDQRVFEFMADQFATRHGAGRDLVTGLDKYLRISPWFFRHTEHRTTSSMMVANLIKIGILLTGNTPIEMAVRAANGISAIHKAILPGAALLSKVPLGLFTAWILPLVDQSKTRYDKPSDRYESIRREMVASLKQAGLDKTYIESVLEDIEIVEKIVNGLNKLGALDSMLYTFITETFTGRRKEFKLQQQYEKLANNDLFKRAAQLSTVGTV
jgi:hypothetical protein